MVSFFMTFNVETGTIKISSVPVLVWVLNYVFLDSGFGPDYVLHFIEGVIIIYIPFDAKQDVKKKERRKYFEP